MNEIKQHPLRDYAVVTVNTHKSNVLGVAQSEVEADSNAMHSNALQPELNWYFLMGLLHFAFPPDPDGANVWGCDEQTLALSHPCLW